MDHSHCTNAVLTGDSEVGDKEVALQQRRGGGMIALVWDPP